MALGTSDRLTDTFELIRGSLCFIIGHDGKVSSRNEPRCQEENPGAAPVWFIQLLTGGVHLFSPTYDGKLHSHNVQDGDASGLK